MAQRQWSKPFEATQHLGDRPHWATVIDRGSFATLTRWFPGCGFNPMQSTHGSAEEARTAGAAWLNSVQPVAA